MVETNQPIKIQLKSQKLLSQQIGKRHYKTLGTSVINTPMSPPSLICIRITYTYINCIPRISHYYNCAHFILKLFRFHQTLVEIVLFENKLNTFAFTIIGKGVDFMEEGDIGLFITLVPKVLK